MGMIDSLYSKMAKPVAKAMIPLMLGTYALPAVAEGSDKLKRPYISGKVSMEADAERDGTVLTSKNGFVVNGPTEITNLGTYDGEGASIEVISEKEHPYALKEICSKINSTSKHRWNPKYNSINQVLEKAKPTDLERKVIQASIGHKDSLVTSCDFTFRELETISYVMGKAGHEVLFVPYRYASNGESTLGLIGFDKKAIDKNLDEAKLIRRHVNELEDEVARLTGANSNLKKWLVGLGIAAAVGIGYGLTRSGDSDDDRDNGRATGGNQF